MDVPGRDRSRKGELLGEDFRHTDFFDADVGVGRDNGTGRVIDSLAHHVHAEQALLLLDHLKVQ